MYLLTKIALLFLAVPIVSVGLLTAQTPPASPAPRLPFVPAPVGDPGSAVPTQPVPDMVVPGTQGVLGTVKTPPFNLPEYLQNVSVTVHTHNHQGSGVIVTRGDTNYILTCAHVLEDLRKVRDVIDPKSGSKRTVIEFDDATVVKEVYESGRSVGKFEVVAEVVRYSDYNHGGDLALLRVRKKNFYSVTTNFSQSKLPVPALTDLVHCGSLRGQFGSNSITAGKMAQIGRVLGNKVYDQTTCPVQSGSSGGGVFLTDGQYIGMLVRGVDATFNFIVPIRRIHEWAERNKVDFVLNSALPAPTPQQLAEVQIEETPGVGGTPSARLDARMQDYPFMIHRLQPAARPLIQVQIGR